MREALLKARKEEAKLTQKELAELAGIDRSTYVHIERGDRVPSLKAALGIARALGKPIEEIFSPGDVLRLNKEVSETSESESKSA